MMVRGKKVTMEYHDVEIDEIGVLEKIYSNTIPKGLEYISDLDDHWYESDGFDYHRREDLYVKSRKATEEELMLRNAYYTLLNHLKGTK